MANVTMTGIDVFKATDAGKYGKAFEINVKKYLNGNRGNSSQVSAKGKTDVRFRGLKLEIKSNCGEINEDILKNDFIVYTMDNVRDFQNPENAVILGAQEFVNLFQSLGLVRSKKSSNGQLKTTIQSYKNSRKKMTALAAALSQYPTLEEWKNLGTALRVC